MASNNTPYPDVHPDMQMDMEIEISDRAGAILMVAELELALSEAIKGTFIPLSKRQEDELFEGNGPVGPMSNKITIGFAIGLYGVETKKQLTLVATVRNKFAHTAGPLYYESEGIKTLINQLPVPRTVKQKNPSLARRFIQTIMVLQDDIIMAGKRRRRRKNAQRPALP